MSVSALSWNVGGILRSTRISGAEIRAYIEAQAADLVCLQEVTDPAALEQLRGRTGIYTVVRAPDGRRDNAILTTLPVLEHGAIDLDGTRPASRTAPYQRVVWATVDAGRPLRVYDCHLPITGVGIADRARAFALVLDHADAFAGSVVICGDMNTTIPRDGFGRRLVQWIHAEPTSSLTDDDAPWLDDERVLFARIAAARGYRDALPIDRTTWSFPHTGWEALGLKLDWFLTRGMRTGPATFGPYLTDHRPITVECIF